MKRLEYLYFNIYYHSSKLSYFPGAMYVRLQAMYLLSIITGGWLLLIHTGYLRLVKHAWYTNRSEAMLFVLSLYLVIALLFHQVFIVKENDQRIFDKYVDRWDRNPNKKRDLFISIGVAVIPYILLMVLKLLLPRP